MSTTCRSFIPCARRQGPSVKALRTMSKNKLVTHNPSLPCLSFICCSSHTPRGPPCGWNTLQSVNYVASYKAASGSPQLVNPEIQGSVPVFPSTPLLPQRYGRLSGQAVPSLPKDDLTNSQGAWQVGQQKGVHSVCGWCYYWTWKCVEISISMLQEWWWWVILFIIFLRSVFLLQVPLNKSTVKCQMQTFLKLFFFVVYKLEKYQNDWQTD